MVALGVKGLQHENWVFEKIRYWDPAPKGPGKFPSDQHVISNSTATSP